MFDEYVKAKKMTIEEEYAAIAAAQAGDEAARNKVVEANLA